MGRKIENKHFFRAGRLIYFSTLLVFAGCYPIYEILDNYMAKI